jgi:hypothetical protein
MERKIGIDTLCRGRYPGDVFSPQTSFVETDGDGMVAEPDAATDTIDDEALDSLDLIVQYQYI